MDRRIGSILPPEKHQHVPSEAKWLTGQGEGTWFTITKEANLASNEYRVRRTSPQGNLDCDRIFVIEEESFDFNSEWDITHVSHCAIVRVIQEGKVYQLDFMREYS